MLVATRDPLPDDSKHAIRDPNAPGKPPHAARFMSVLQVAGAVLGIPVALGSAYSVYQANFSPDTQCQSLRANIVAMIDKQLDAATRRMLVRRDVETFEKSCASFDPDARAAFVSLLAEPQKADAKPAAPRQIEIKAAEKKVEPVKPEPVKAVAAPKVETKVEAKVEPKAEAKPVARVAAPAVAPAPVAALEQTPENDVRWLDSVRGALVAHGEPAAEPVQKPVDAIAAKLDDKPVESAVARPVEKPVEKQAAVTHQAPLPQPSWLAEEPAPRAPVQAVAVPPVATVVPVLPPATAIATPPVAREISADPDRLVPPGSIPNATAQVVPQPEANKPARAGWLSKIPLVGSAIDERF